VSGFETPTRLARSEGGDAMTALAGRLLRVLEGSPARLSPSARARIAVRLDEAARPVESERRRVWWPALAAAALLLFVGGVVGAAWGLAPARRFFGHAPAPIVVAPARVTPSPVPPPVVVPVAPPPEISAAPAPRPHTRTLAVARPAPAPAPADPVVAESRVLGDALTALRQRHDPERALRALDQYDERFPAGVLALEASAARVDALLALGRRGQALARLEEMPLARAPRGAELRVLRGELRAGRADCAGAIEDFSALLGGGNPPAAVVERALYGRGSCRSRVGDPTGARADLKELLRRFPTGPFAAPAGRALRD
jgi:hypothetical protein